MAVIFGDDLSKAAILRKRKLAETMANNATDTSPVGHWTQALARAVQGGVSGYQGASADAKEGERNRKLAEALSGASTTADFENIAIQSGDIDSSDVLKNRYEIAQAEARRKEAQDEYGLSPYYEWGDDPNNPGKKVLQAYQLNKYGDKRAIPGTPAEPQNMYNTPYGGHQYGKYSGVQDGAQPTVPVDPAQVEKDKTQGDIAGKMAGNLDTIRSNAKFALDQVRNLKKHPGKKYAVGDAARAYFGPIYGDQAAFVAEHDSLKAKNFLAVYDSLRGAGHITDQEGEKGMAAFSALNRATTEEEYDRQLGIIEEVIAAGLANAEKKATLGPRVAPTPQPAPAAGGRLPYPGDDPRLTEAMWNSMSPEDQQLWMNSR